MSRTARRDLDASKIHLANLFVALHLRGCAVENDLAPMQHGDPVRERQSDIDIVLDHYDGYLARKFRDKSRQLLALTGREARARFIQQENTGRRDQCHGNFELAPLTIGEDLHRLASPVIESDAREASTNQISQSPKGGDRPEHDPLAPVVAERRKYQVVV